jgi:hypothetical protein
MNKSIVGVVRGIALIRIVYLRVEHESIIGQNSSSSVILLDYRA